jgi:phosphatidylethanolamine/phosphatidyl-N-methylethanolamine N-methyltransferase
MSDLRPELLKSLNISDKKIVVESESINAEKLPYQNDSFDRLISTCLLTHLKNPEDALKEWKRVVKPGGIISIYIPCEPGILLRIVQSLTTRRKQLKLGIDAKYIHYSEHPYHHPYLTTLVDYTFKKNYISRSFPFIFGGFNLNLWTIVTIRNLK